MCDLSMESLLKKDPVLPRVAAAEEVLWFNPGLQSAETALSPMELGMADILDAEARLQRFAPFIRERFPETAPRGGLIESPLTPIPRMQRLLEERFGAVIPGRLLLKQDSHLAIAGSVKARGGIYEVLKHTEELAMENGLPNWPARKCGSFSAAIPSRWVPPATWACPSASLPPRWGTRSSST